MQRTKLNSCLPIQSLKLNRLKRTPLQTLTTLDTLLLVNEVRLLPARDGFLRAASGAQAANSTKFGRILVINARQTPAGTFSRCALILMAEMLNQSNTDSAPIGPSRTGRSSNKKPAQLFQSFNVSPWSHLRQIPVRISNNRRPNPAGVHLPQDSSCKVQEEPGYVHHTGVQHPSQSDRRAHRRSPLPPEHHTPSAYPGTPPSSNRPKGSPVWPP